jgi:hypothetical protein
MDFNQTTVKIPANIHLQYSFIQKFPMSLLSAVICEIIYMLSLDSKTGYVEFDIQGYALAMNVNHKSVITSIGHLEHLGFLKTGTVNYEPVYATTDEYFTETRLTDQTPQP